MTEAISNDPVFQEMAKGMQEAMLAGGMGGLTINSDEDEDAGAAAAAGGLPGMPGMPSMPAMDPSKVMEAMQRMMTENPEFMTAAESLGRGLMAQSMDKESLAMLELFQNPANQAALKKRMDDLKEDPELSDVLKDIEENGQGALMKYMNEPEIMAKVGRKFQEAMDDPEFRKQLQSGGKAAALNATGTEEEEEVEEEEETLISMILEGKLDKLKEALATEGANADFADEEGRTALHFASGYGDIEAMKLLLDAGADVNAKDGSGNTSLHYSAGYGCTEASVLLVEFGVDTSVRNDEGKTAADVAELNSETDVTNAIRGEE